MKLTRRILIVSFVSIFCFSDATAIDTFWSAGFYFKIIGYSTVEIIKTPTTNLYYGDIILPFEVYGEYELHSAKNFRVTKIGADAFLNNFNLTSIIIPGTVTQIGSCAFSNCRALTSVIMYKGVKTIGDRAFHDLQALANVEIPNSVTTIDEDAFRGCTALTRIDLPISLITINNGAFRGCDKLNKIVIPDRVNTIGEKAFMNCSNLNKVIIGKKVNSIKENAFSFCTSLKSIYSLNTTPPTISSSTFDTNTFLETKLYVPLGCKERYMNNDFWKCFCNIIEFNPNHGDVNGDGEINIADINKIIDIILSDNSEDYGYDADVNADREINIADINKIIDIVLNGNDDEDEKPDEVIKDLLLNAGGHIFKMVAVDGGSFILGDDGTTWYEESFPTLKVNLSSYYIAETEVTQGLWQEIMGSNPSYYDGDLSLPVETVSWYDCQTFFNKLNNLSGFSFRLPTEAEWEFAARGGNMTHGYKYAGSNDYKEVAWFSFNSSSKTHPVGQKNANELGLYDMSGNVCEWCKNWYEDWYEVFYPNPQGPSTGTERVIRGGSFYTSPEAIYIDRSHLDPYICTSRVGLRLAL